MRLRFNKAVRDSLAQEMKSVANLGGAGFALLLGDEIMNTEKSWALVVIVGFWLLLQLMAHVIIAFEMDEDDEEK